MRLAHFWYASNCFMHSGLQDSSMAGFGHSASSDILIMLRRSLGAEPRVDRAVQPRCVLVQRCYLPAFFFAYHTPLLQATICLA